ncbi:hypothetical protein ZIOFF_045361 [Zingiber officinale]|uniref:Biogenesis of lysosome-related organelles complex 1 subunit 1 n=2 Tax=Zingiber officinale TaxID=94328 RepID=A0A8J5G0V0_ZINOF|nr:hypothetical protein ZIOFF_045361 [Zingiber officinale]
MNLLAGYTVMPQFSPQKASQQELLPSGRIPGAMEGVKTEVGSLESSLLQIVQEHQRRSICIREKTDKAKKDALQTAIRVSELLVETVNGQVEATFINEKRIELEIRALVSTIMRYKKQTDQWLAASHAMNTVIKVLYPH